MARDTLGETRYLKRALVDRPRMRCAASQHFRPRDQGVDVARRRSPRLRAGRERERADRTETVGEAQDRAAAARLEFRDCREKLGADRRREFAAAVAARRRAHAPPRDR